MLDVYQRSLSVRTVRAPSAADVAVAGVVPLASEPADSGYSPANRVREWAWFSVTLNHRHGFVVIEKGLCGQRITVHVLPLYRSISAKK